MTESFRSYLPDDYAGCARSLRGSFRLQPCNEYATNVGRRGGQKLIHESEQTGQREGLCPFDSQPPETAENAAGSFSLTTRPNSLAFPADRSGGQKQQSQNVTAG